MKYAQPWAGFEPAADRDARPLYLSGELQGWRLASLARAIVSPSSWTPPLYRPHSAASLGSGDASPMRTEIAEHLLESAHSYENAQSKAIPRPQSRTCLMGMCVRLPDVGLISTSRAALNTPGTTGSFIRAAGLAQKCAAMAVDDGVLLRLVGTEGVLGSPSLMKWAG